MKLSKLYLIFAIVTVMLISSVYADTLIDLPFNSVEGTYNSTFAENLASGNDFNATKATYVTAGYKDEAYNTTGDGGLFALDFLTCTTNCTVLFAVKNPVGASGVYIAKYDTLSNRRGWSTELSAGQFKVLLSTDGAAAQKSYITDSEDLDTNEWYTAGFTWNSGGQLWIYINGTNVTTTKTTDSAMTTINNPATNITIGYRQLAGAESSELQSTIDEILVLNSTYNEAQVLAWHDTLAEEPTVAQTAYYFSNSGSDSNNGTLGFPLKTIAKYNLLQAGGYINAGDTVYFDRGSVWYLGDDAFPVLNDGTLADRITYQAYGTGALPQFHGSMQTDFIDMGSNLYKSTANSSLDVGHILCNNHTVLADLQNSSSDVNANLEIFYNVSGDDGTIAYSDIDLTTLDCELGVEDNIFDIENIEYVNFYNLSLWSGGQHGIGGEGADYIIVADSTFWHIGGAFQKQTHELIRYGNCVEFGQSNSNIEVRDSKMVDCFDAGITTQSWDGVHASSDVRFHHNTIINCTYGVEHFMSETGCTVNDLEVDHNTIVYTGKGMGLQDGHTTAMGFRFSEAQTGTTNVTIHDNIIANSTNREFVLGNFANNWRAPISLDYNIFTDDVASSNFISWNNTAYTTYAAWTAGTEQNPNGAEYSLLYEDFIDFVPVQGSPACTASSTGSYVGAEPCDCVTPVDDLVLTQNTTLCGGTYQLNDTNNDGIIIVDADDVTLNCNTAKLIGNNTGWGINSTKRFSMYNCILQNYSRGITLNSGADNSLIYNNSISGNNSGIGIRVSARQNVTIDNCTLYNLSYGITLDGVNTTAKRNTIYNINNYGITMSANNNLIENNSFVRIFDKAIYIDSARHNNTITNNYFGNFPSTGDIAIYGYLGAYDNIIEDNNFDGKMIAIMLSYRNKNYSIKNNYIDSLDNNNNNFQLLANNSQHRIINNTIFGLNSGTSTYAFIAHGLNDTLIQNNKFYKAHHSFAVLNQTPRNNTNLVIIDNTFGNGDIGLYCSYCMNTLIKNNTIINTSANIDVYDLGIKIKKSYNITVIDNNLTEMTSAGIWMQNVYNSNITNNSFDFVNIDSRSNYLANDIMEPPTAIVISPLYKSYLTGGLEEHGDTDSYSTLFYQFENKNIVIGSNTYDNDTQIIAKISNDTATINLTGKQNIHRLFAMPENITLMNHYYLNDANNRHINLTYYNGTKRDNPFEEYYYNSGFKRTYYQMYRTNVTFRNANLQGSRVHQYLIGATPNEVHRVLNGSSLLFGLNNQTINLTVSYNNVINVQYASGDCIGVTDDLTLTTNTILCNDRYEVSDSGTDGVIKITAPDVILDCNGADIVGDFTTDSLGITLLSNVNRSTIKNCNISNYKTAIQRDGATYGQTTYFKIYNNTFDNFTGHIINADGFDDSLITNNTFLNSNYNALRLHSTDRTNASFNTIYVSNSSLWGILIDGRTNRVHNNNIIINGLTGCGVYGIFTEADSTNPQYDNIIYNNTIQSKNQKCNGVQGTSNYARNFTFVNNTFINLTYGIYSFKANSTILSNRFYNCSTGIFVGATDYNQQVLNNTIIGYGMNTAIRIYGNLNATIFGNNITANDYGISFYNVQSKPVTISNNIFNDIVLYEYLNYGGNVTLLSNTYLDSYARFKVMADPVNVSINETGLHIINLTNNGIINFTSNIRHDFSVVNSQVLVNPTPSYYSRALNGATVIQDWTTAIYSLTVPSSNLFTIQYASSAIPPTVTLNDPVNGYSSLTDTKTINFSCTVIDIQTINNLSLYIWYNNGLEYANVSVALNTTSNTTNWTVYVQPDGNYIWNCKASNAEVSGWGTNRTFEMDTYNFISGGNTITPALSNVTYVIPSSGIYFISISVGNYCLNITGGTYAGNYCLLSTFPTSLNIGNTAANIYIYDEQNLHLIDYATTLVDVIGTEYAINLSTTNGTLTIQNMTRGRYEIRYEAPEYHPRTYFINFDGLSNPTVYLYLINESTAISDRVILTLVDEYNDPAQNIIIKLQRNFIEGNVSIYKTVSMSKTNFEGQAILYVEPYDIWYKMIYESADGNVYKTTDSSPFMVSNPTDSLVLTANPYTSWYMMNDIYQNLSVINESGNFYVKYTYNDISNFVRTGCLEVQRVTAKGVFGVCNNCTDASSATISCLIDTTLSGQYKAVGKVDTNSNGSWYSIQEYFDLLNINNIPYGQEGVFMGAVLIGTMALMGVGAIVSSLIFVAMGFIGLVILHFVVGFNLSFIIWIIALVFIIIFMIMKSRSE